MDESKRIEIEQACLRVCIEYARAIDFGDYERFAALFGDDGILDTGFPLQGREKILAGLKRRDPQLRSRHVLTNIAIDVRDETSATGIAYLSLYRHIGPESGHDEPIELQGPAGVGHYEDEFVKTDEGWRFAKRSLRMAFMRSDSFPDRKT